jgi:hypothetical protein
MRILWRASLAFIGLCGIVIAAGAASSATTTIDTHFAAVSISETPTQFFPGEPAAPSWKFSTSTLGPCPILANLQISYLLLDGASATFSLNAGNGNILTGVANSAGTGADLSTLSGTVTTGYGTYSGMVGQPVTFNLAVNPSLIPLVAPPTAGAGQELAPAAMVGTLIIS